MCVRAWWSGEYFGLKEVYVHRFEQKRERGAFEAMEKKSVWFNYKACIRGTGLQREFHTEPWDSIQRQAGPAEVLWAKKPQDPFVLRKPTPLLWGEWTEFHLTLPVKSNLKLWEFPGSRGLYSNEKVWCIWGKFWMRQHQRAPRLRLCMASDGCCANAGRSESRALAQKKTVPGLGPPARRPALWLLPSPWRCWAPFPGRKNELQKQRGPRYNE